jgi:thermostable 8-oxoguanine DNA glycosylase
LTQNLCFIVSPSTTSAAAATKRQQQQQTHTMYLSEHELNAILQTPYYSQPYSTSFVNYTFYRGRYNANVLIICFNVQNDLFNETFTSNSSDFQSFLDSGVGKLIFINLLYSFCQ